MDSFMILIPNFRLQNYVKSHFSCKKLYIDLVTAC